MPAPEWKFPDADGNLFTMDDWAGKIMGVSYVDPDESEMNEEFSDRVKKAIDVDSLISRDSFKGIGIADCASSWKPDFLIKAIGGRKAKKYETTVLFDSDAILRKSWNLYEDSYNIIILDKDRIVRGIYKEKMTELEMDEALQLIINLQK
ncbi:MAG: YtfJ family protein [Candidatus Marinimicrobia bacterium]|jgi:predicted transcriptional regulator|nr:YtfJ family protein [Candidatus Neomarinimicrobiota bacterium]